MPGSGALEVCEIPPVSPNDTRAPAHTGLTSAWLAGVLALSVAVFLFWDGALWEVPSGTAHVARIAISYAVVIPAVAVGLWSRRAWSVRRLATSIGLIWMIKLVLTSTLYALLVPSGPRYAPVRPWEASAAPVVRSGGRR